MRNLNVDSLPPCEWPLDWPDDDPIAKANATDPLTLSDYQRMARRTALTKRKSDKMEEALLGLAGGAGFAKSERAAAQGKLPEGCVEAQCSNAHCISQTEQGLPHLAAPVPGRPGVYRCVWCDHLI